MPKHQETSGLVRLQMTEPKCCIHSCWRPIFYPLKTKQFCKAPLSPWYVKLILELNCCSTRKTNALQLKENGMHLLSRILSPGLLQPTFSCSALHLRAPSRIVKLHLSHKGALKTLSGICASFARKPAWTEICRYYWAVPGWGRAKWKWQDGSAEWRKCNWDQNWLRSFS